MHKVIVHSLGDRPSHLLSPHDQAALHDWLPDALALSTENLWVLSSSKDVKKAVEKGLPDTKVRPLHDLYAEGNKPFRTSRALKVVFTLFPLRH